MLVAQSIECVNSIHHPISNSAEIKHEVNSTPNSKQDFVISDVSSVEIRTSCKLTVKSYEKKSVNVKEDSEKVPSSERRCSARIQDKLKKEKIRVVHIREELLDDVNENGSRKKKRVYQKRKGNSTSPGEPKVFRAALGLKEATYCVEVGGDEVMNHGLRVGGENGVASECVLGNVVEKSAYARVKESLMNNNRPRLVGENGVAGEGVSGNMVEKSAYAKVKEVLRTFNKHYLHFVQEEEMRCKKVEVPPKTAAGLKLKKGDAHDYKQSAKRPDLKAITKMLETNAILYPQKRFGPIPGIDVGHQFYSRAEMVIVGFHSHWLNGIDYMGQSYSKGEYGSYTFPLAVSIVLSGVYEDDLDNSEDVVYTGQGGNNLLGNKRQVCDQVLARGNLALKNCLEQCVPVRLIRGHKSASSYVGKVYTYDGLYKVVQYWAEKGVSGFTIFKYRLRRLEGQPILTTNQVLYGNGRAPKSISEIRGLVCEDISGGQEDIPIPATNLVDDPPVAPTGYIYCKSMQVSKSLKLPPSVVGCDCKENCMDSRSCSCAKLNGCDFPYVHRDGGRLIEAKDVVFECGPKCGCGPGCVNRTSQRGLKYRFEVFRTPKKGWAVRSWDFIPSGAPICEYIGKLMRTDELDNVYENNYIFDIDCLQTMKGLDGRERRSRDISLASSNFLDKSEDHKSDVPEFCIDAGSTGNIARFFNHSCEPNLFVQCVLSSHHDAKLARVMLFAADNIPPMQELTYDYGYALDSVLGPDGKTKKMLCFCGAADCRKRLL